MTEPWIDGGHGAHPWCGVFFALIIALGLFAATCGPGDTVAIPVAAHARAAP